MDRHNEISNAVKNDATRYEVAILIKKIINLYANNEKKKQKLKILQFYYLQIQFSNWEKKVHASIEELRSR